MKYGLSEVLIGIIIALILGVAQHSYGTNERLNNLEVRQVYDSQAIQETREDVREIKTFLMGR